MTTIEQIKQELERRIAWNTAITNDNYIYEYVKPQIQSDRALLTAIKGLEKVASFYVCEDASNFIKEAHQTLQTIATNWNK